MLKRFITIDGLRWDANSGLPPNPHPFRGSSCRTRSLHRFRVFTFLLPQGEELKMRVKRIDRVDAYSVQSNKERSPKFPHLNPLPQGEEKKILTPMALPA